MARLVHYQNFTPDPATAAVRPRLYHDPFYLYGQVDLLSQMAQGTLVYMGGYVKRGLGFNAYYQDR